MSLTVEKLQHDRLANSLGFWTLTLKTPTRPKKFVIARTATGSYTVADNKLQLLATLPSLREAVSVIKEAIR